jgi:hypothetical protein
MSCGEKNFEPNAWGPLAWQYLHVIAFSYPVNPTDVHRKVYETFLRSFGKTLPCKECRENFGSYLNSKHFDARVDLKNCDAFAKFVFRVHNHVNLRLGKKVIPWEKYAVLEKYYRTMQHEKSRTEVVLVRDLL